MCPIDVLNCFHTQLLHLNHDGRGELGSKDGQEGEEDRRGEKAWGSTVRVHQVFPTANME